MNEPRIERKADTGEILEMSRWSGAGTNNIGKARLLLCGQRSSFVDRTRKGL
jgi:hypothetical protein